MTDKESLLRKPIHCGAKSPIQTVEYFGLTTSLSRRQSKTGPCKSHRFCPLGSPIDLETLHYSPSIVCSVIVEEDGFYCTLVGRSSSLLRKTYGKSTWSNCDCLAHCCSVLSAAIVIVFSSPLCRHVTRVLFLCFYFFLVAHRPAFLACPGRWASPLQLF